MKHFIGLNILYLPLLFVATTMQGQPIPDKPTLEQLYNTDTVKISFECRRDLNKENVDMESWMKIAVAVDELIDKCYLYPDERDDQLYEELFDVIRLIRAELSKSSSKDIQTLLEVSSGTSSKLRVSLDS